MSVVETDVLIVGAGLTGLSLAHHLTTANRDFLVLEARDRIGGRIHTFTTSDGTPVEMGATWYFPFFRSLFSLLKGLKVELVEQYMRGATMYESDVRSPVRRVNQGDDGGDMFRIKGGTDRLVRTLLAKIDESRVRLGTVVTHITRLEDGWMEVRTGGDDGTTYRARRVVTTVPPQLLSYTVVFSPALPDGVMAAARETHTWMGDAVKGAVTYATPFWKEAGLAGALYSQSGPFVQMYDQSNSDGTKFALVGFMDGKISQLSYEERKRRTVAQLVRVFGEAAANCLDYRDTVWAKEEFTMPQQQGGVRRLPSHKNNGHAVYQQSHMGGGLYIGGTETSPSSGGYMEGAVNSAAAIAKWLNNEK